MPVEKIARHIVNIQAFGIHEANDSAAPLTEWTGQVTKNCLPTIAVHPVGHKTIRNGKEVRQALRFVAISSARQLPHLSADHFQNRLCQSALIPGTCPRALLAPQLKEEPSCSSVPQCDEAAVDAFGAGPRVSRIDITGSATSCQLSLDEQIDDAVADAVWTNRHVDIKIQNEAGLGQMPHDRPHLRLLLGVVKIQPQDILPVSQRCCVSESTSEHTIHDAPQGTLGPNTRVASRPKVRARDSVARHLCLT
mmetsp:Transcript_78900/g.254881  ORF Transcript_78900/g.254881 Transcript_78900/m.254881 type:complete len:251 (-) Transcript_78900:33-785(-)